MHTATECSPRTERIAACSLDLKQRNSSFYYYRLQQGFLQHTTVAVQITWLPLARNQGRAEP